MKTRSMWSPSVPLLARSLSRPGRAVESKRRFRFDIGVLVAAGIATLARDLVLALAGAFLFASAIAGMSARQTRFDAHFNAASNGTAALQTSGAVTCRAACTSPDVRRAAFYSRGAR